MSFSAELNDFVKGFETGNKLIDRYDDKAYKQMRTKLMGTQNEVLGQKLIDARDPELRKMNRALIGARTGYLGAMADRLRNGPQARPGGPGETYDNGDAPINIPDVTPAAPAPGPQSALEPDEDTAQFAAEGGQIVDQGEVDKMVDGARAIGDKNPTIGALERLQKKRVKGYAEGGTVEDDDEDDTSGMSGGMEDDTLPDSAAPTEGAGSFGGFSVQAGRDAVAAALQHGPQAYGLNQSQQRRALPAGPDPQRAQRVRAYMSGQGAPSPQLMQQVYAKVDPDKKLSDSQRTMAALSAVRQFYLRQGNVKAANNAVLGIVQQNRINYMHYSALAKAALEGGNLDGAAQFASKAYSNVPTGKDVKIVNENGRLVYTATDDATGKTIRKGIMTPQELGAAVTGFTPDKFDSTLAELAGQKPGKPALAPRGDKPADLKTRQELIEGATQPTDPEKPEKGIDDVRSMANGLLQHNKVLPADAIKMSRMLTDPSQKPTRTEAEGGAYYKFKGGPKMFVPDDMIERMVEMRLANSPEGDVPIGSSRASDDPTSKDDTGKEGVSALGKIEGTKLPRRDNTQRIARQSADQFTGGATPARTTAAAASALPTDDQE